ncbi:hypothetical protein M3F30_07050, partial [Corynebacterium sanguinis]
SVADVQRVRRQRRLAQTEQEYSTVRSHMRDLASDLKSKPTIDAKLIKIYGIVVIVFGLIIGGFLFYATFLIWPSFVENLKESW